MGDGQTNERMDGISPHFTGLRPLPGPLNSLSEGSPGRSEGPPGISAGPRGLEKGSPGL